MQNIFHIFIKFFTLGLISFGGPMAHIAYFRKRFVEQLNWLDDNAYSRILALSQFLPGPSSSQVGFAIGLKKGGLLGAITAFVAFTFPSFFILYLLSTFNLSNTQNTFILGLILGLKLFAVVIVSDATISMFKSFCKDKITVGIFVIATFILVAFSSAFIQIIVLILGAIAGRFLIKEKKEEMQEEIKKTKKVPLFIFLFLLFVLPFFIIDDIQVEVFASFYEVGSLVFGGGHVVLPLLEQSLASFVTKEDFLVAYSLAQAVPGPMFTIASYLGADIISDSPFLGAVIATLAIFLPGFLLILAFIDSFESYSKRSSILNAIAGVNAAVVALLFSVLIISVGPNAIYSFLDFILVACGLLLIRNVKMSIIYVILLFILIGIIKKLSYFLIMI